MAVKKIKLSDKRERFLQEYLIDLNGKQAAIRAGYSPRSAESTASTLLSNPKVRARLDQLMAERSKRTGVTADRVVRELARIAFADATQVAGLDDAALREDATEDDRAAIAGVKAKIVHGEDGAKVVERELKFWDKNKALELLGKHLALFQDRVKVDATAMVQIVDDIPADSGGGEDAWLCKN